MNLAKGLKRITLLMAIAAATGGGICFSAIPICKYYDAKNQWGVMDPIVVKQPNEQEIKQFDKWVQEMAVKGTVIDANYYVIDSEANFPELSLPSLQEIQPSLLQASKVRFWRNLSEPKLVGICILAGLAGATVSFFSVWFFFWFGGLAVYRIIRWVVLGFCDEELKS